MKNKLRLYRAMHQVTQQGLAEAVGVSRQTINALEREKYVPSTILALKISRYFKVRVEELFILE